MFGSGTIRYRLMSKGPRPNLSCIGISAFLIPFLNRVPQSSQIQTRGAHILGSLSDNRGSYNKRIRKGRGPASGKGKTSGRGHKGQKQHGKVPTGFQGGQTPLEKVKGRRGFKNVLALDLSKVNLDTVQSWINQGRLDITKPITVKDLHESRCTHGIKDGVKLLARNAHELRSPIHITVSRASQAAIAAVEAAGGSVTTRYYTRASLQRILRGLTHPTLSNQSAEIAMGKTETPVEDTTRAVLAQESRLQLQSSKLLGPSPRAYRYRLTDPASRKDIEYYRDPAHRGYMSWQLKEGEGPSLFFKSPEQIKLGAEKSKAAKESSRSGKKADLEGRLW